MTDKKPLLIDHASDNPESLPPEQNTRYRCKLDDAVDVKRELAKLYRETRSGMIDPSDATKLGWLLGEVRKTIELEQKTTDAQSNLDGYKFVVERAKNLPVSINEFV